MGHQSAQFNMEPENDGSFSRGVFVGFHVNLPGCMCVFLVGVELGAVFSP